MTGEIDSAHARLLSALPRQWVLSSITINGALGYNVVAMSHAPVQPGEVWQVAGAGQSIAGALHDAAAKLESLARR